MSRLNYALSMVVVLVNCSLKWLTAQKQGRIVFALNVKRIFSPRSGYCIR